MKTKIIILFTVIFALQMNATFAQGCEDEPPPAKKSTKLEIVEEKTEVKQSSSTFFGYFQPQYNNYFTDDATNTFNFKRARFGVRGRVSDNFSYYVVMETSDFLSSDGNPYLLDAFITYDKNEWAKISLGSFKQQFGREVTTACNNLTTIDRAIVSDQLVSPQRDMGIMLLGGSNATKFRYSIALMNGIGLAVNDNNTKKDIIGRLAYKLSDILSIGGSFRYGHPNNNENDRTTVGADIKLTYNKFNIQGEFIYDEGDYNKAAEGGCGAEPVTLGDFRQGGYVMVSYDTNNKFQPVFKYEFFDADKSLEKVGYQEMMTLGVNYFFNDKVRLQVNYQNKIEGGISVDNDALLMQLQLKL